ncbi:MAG TPA: SDR family oxidoreductase [Gemmatimonadales bacterium]|nr:SDR family oxidoreductase [Gemmatimonadales bacterium]
MISLRGKRALVTGGTRGIGKATVELLRAAGAEVTAAGRRTHGDLGDPARAAALAAAVTGPLDILVVSHGVWEAEGVPLARMDQAQWRSTISQNLDSVFHVVRALGPRMAEGGAIVLVASTAAQRGEALHADYAASKGALVALTKSLAVEMAPRVRVNCVAPGWADTEMAARPYAGGGRAAIEATIPLGRVASAQDVAGPIVFLCSELARHVTGEILNVNGGSVLCG